MNHNIKLSSQCFKLKVTEGQTLTRRLCGWSEALRGEAAIAAAVFRCSGKLPLFTCCNTGSWKKRFKPLLVVKVWFKRKNETVILAEKSGGNCFYRLNQRWRFNIGASVVQVDLPGLGDGRGPVEIHQLVEGRELLGPQEVLAMGVSHHFEVLDVVLVSEGRRRQSNFVSFEDQLPHQHKPVIKNPLSQIQNWKITSSSAFVDFSFQFFFTKSEFLNIPENWLVFLELINNELKK